MTRRGGWPEEVFDPGLQQERTALAWDRTGVAILVAAAVMLRDAVVNGLVVFIAVASAFIGVGAVVLVVAYLRYGALHATLRRAGTVAEPILVRVVGTATVAFNALALGLIVWETA